MKGRPPGTKKSTDPDKKKRKRVARERDLCDVKIKITEYFDGDELREQTGQQPPLQTHPSLLDGAGGGNQFYGQNAGPAGTWGMQSLSMGQVSAQQKKFYTIQRVNGNGGNGKGDGVAGPHKHQLEESDRVKKNSVVRWLMKNDRERKKIQVRGISIISCLFFFLPAPRLLLSLMDACGVLGSLVVHARYSSIELLHGVRGHGCHLYGPRHIDVHHIPRVHEKGGGDTVFR